MAQSPSTSNQLEQLLLLVLVVLIALGVYLTIG
jgi:hypothetical protein